MCDRLEEIKGRYRKALDVNAVPSINMIPVIASYIKLDDVGWLISELEQCKAEIKVLEELIDSWRATCITEQTVGMEWKERALKAEAENKELQAVFDLQETRTKKAEKMWQEATGKRHILPDLGVLLDWLMGERERCMTGINVLVETYTLVIEELREEKTYQRRHRKYAIREARELLREGRMIDKAAAFQFKLFEKLETEVGRLKSLLSHHGISF